LIKKMAWCLMLLTLSAAAATPTQPAQPAQPAQPGVDCPAPQPAAVERWQDMRFGMFIHWGFYAVPAGFHQAMRRPT